MVLISWALNQEITPTLIKELENKTEKSIHISALPQIAVNKAVIFLSYPYDTVVPQKCQLKLVQ